jgi:hypothetical protein
LAALSGNALLVTILVHVLFGVGAVYLVVEHFQKKHINFQATGPPAQHTEIEHKVQLAKKNDTESAPPDLKRITTTDVSAITVPDIPDTPVPEDAAPTAMSGVDGVMGSGTGEGNGTGGSGEASPFGSFDDPATPQLQGNLYDLKQTADGKPTGMTPDKYHQTLIQFVAEDWDPGVFQKFYKSKKALNTSCIFVPTIHAEDGPRAFGVESEVQPNMYVMWYKVTASPTQDGTYHFVGMADDILVVRANGQTVLDGSLIAVKPALYNAEKRYAVLDFNTTNASEEKGLYVGTALHLKAGDPVDIDILIGEEPGGYSHYFLYLQREESNYDKQSNGMPLLPVFKLDSNPIHPQTPPPSYPPFSTTFEPWQAAQPNF